MTTKAKEAVGLLRSQGSAGQVAIALAVAVIKERISSLPKDDRNDLYALAKELPAAETEEDIESIIATMLEILEQDPIRATQLNQENDPPPGARLQKWIDWVSAKIHALRKAARLTQTELAEKAGLPQSHISRLEAGQHSPSRATLEKIAAALGVEVGVFDPSA